MPLLVWAKKPSDTTVPLKGKKSKGEANTVLTQQKIILKKYIIGVYSLLPESKLLELEPYRDILERSFEIINNKLHLIKYL